MCRPYPRPEGGLIGSVLGTIHALLAAAALALALAPAGSLPTLADELTDQAGLLTGAEDQVRAALAAARDEVQLFVLTVATTEGTPVTRYAEEVAESNSLGGNDALLVVAIDDRAYSLWVADALTEVTDAEIDRVSRDGVEPHLTAGDFPGAVVAAAEGLAAAVEGEVAPAGSAPGAGDPSPRRSTGPGLGAVLLLLGLFGFGAMTVAERIRARQGRKRSAEERNRRTGALARRANTLLVASDEAVREATTELGFAEAEFPDEDAAPLAAALAAARTELSEAFAVRQRLDDDVPESPDQREAMLQEIIDRAERVDELLSAEHQRLDDLRDLQRRAPALLAALPAELDAVADRVTAAEPLAVRIVAASPTAADAIDGNLVEARKHLAAARSTVAAAVGGAPDDGPARIRTLRAAQRDLAAAQELVAAVERAAAELDEAERELEAALRSADVALTAATEAVDVAGQQAPRARLADGRRLLEQAQSHRTDDPLRSYELARKADAAANDVLGSLREAEERQQRERAAADAALHTADAVLARTADYVATRRQGVGREARTRLQEAERHLARARAARETDPREAVRLAEEAERLADEAYRLARSDFDDFDRLRGPYGRGPFGGGYGRGGVVVIGGFPIPLGGSGRGGGGFGGSPWGGGRSVGGGFGGGGGRVSGGRF